jgi:heme o synthase
MRAYLNLTKPRISLLFAITGLAALIVEGSLLNDPSRMWLIVLAIFLTGGSANAFNQYFERDVDSRMERTAKKRPLPLGEVSANNALIFSVATGVIGSVVLWYYGGWLAAAFGVGTILFYSLYYTLWLKPRTPYNIVIGGMAGATAPLIGWAAATGHVAWAPLFMFLIIFFWTPPHFWALAICCKEDYARVGYPMLPLVKGDEATRRQILGYSLTLVPLALGLAYVADFGLIYGIGALLLSSYFVWEAWAVYTTKTIKSCWRLFAYSIVYVMLLFGCMILDALV